MEEESEIDDKAVAEGTMEMEETSEVKERHMQRRLLNILGGGSDNGGNKIESEEATEEGENPEIAKTEAGGKDGVEEMIVAEEKVGADATEAVEKSEAEK
eukprot:4534162-Ditylum_brightwellii.AAC.1